MQPEIYRSQGVADAVGYPGGQLAHHGQFARLQEMFLAALQFSLGLVHVLDEAVHPAAQGLDFIRHPGARVGRRGGKGQLANRPQDLFDEDICQQ